MIHRWLESHPDVAEVRGRGVPAHSCSNHLCSRILVYVWTRGHMDGHGISNGPILMVRFSKLSPAHTLQVGVMDHHRWVWRTCLELDRLQDQTRSPHTVVPPSDGSDCFCSNWFQSQGVSLILHQVMGNPFLLLSTEIDEVAASQCYPTAMLA